MTAVGWDDKGDESCSGSCCRPAVPAETPRPRGLLARLGITLRATRKPRPQSVDALLDAYTDQRRALQRLLWLIARHPDRIATDPTAALNALDAHPRAHGWCPPGCTGTCTPHPALDARHRALTPGAPS